jgi:mannitol-1-/sugar-/sorbitol-6-/2-deoxyglucose-6-phosphatase
MDGLMIDSEPLWFRVEGDFARARGGTWTEALALECVGRGIPTTLGRMREVFGFDVDLAVDAAHIVDLFILRVRELELKPGCAELLAAAKGRVPIALASSSPSRLIGAVLARFDLGAAFHAVVSGEQVARPKPAPDIFLRAAEELGVAPSACAVLEDSLAGATAGRAAGALVIAVPEGDPAGRGFDEVADAVVPDLFDARALLDLGPGP